MCTWWRAQDLCWHADMCAACLPACLQVVAMPRSPLSSSTCSCPTVAASRCWWGSMLPSSRQTWGSHWWTWRCVCVLPADRERWSGLQGNKGTLCMIPAQSVHLRRARTGEDPSKQWCPAPPTTLLSPHPPAGQHAQQHDAAGGGRAGGTEGPCEGLLPRAGRARQPRGQGSRGGRCSGAGHCQRLVQLCGPGSDVRPAAVVSRRRCTGAGRGRGRPGHLCDVCWRVAGLGRKQLQGGA